MRLETPLGLRTDSCLSSSPFSTGEEGAGNIGGTGGEGAIRFDAAENPQAGAAESVRGAYTGFSQESKWQLMVVMFYEKKIKQEKKTHTHTNTKKQTKH